MRRGYLKKGSPMYRPEAIAPVSARKEKEKEKEKKETKRNTEITRFDLLHSFMAPFIKSGSQSEKKMVVLNQRFAKNTVD